MGHGHQELRRSLEQMLQYLARADDELKAAQRLLDPKASPGTEINRAIAAARISVDDAMETVRWRMSETESE